MNESEIVRRSLFCCPGTLGKEGMVEEQKGERERKKEREQHHSP